MCEGFRALLQTRLLHGRTRSSALRSLRSARSSRRAPHEGVSSDLVVVLLVSMLGMTIRVSCASKRSEWPGEVAAVVRAAMDTDATARHDRR